MKNRTYSLSEQTLQEIEEIKEKTILQGVNLDASTIVRIALARGLPLVLEHLSLETSSSDNRQPFALV